MTGMLLDDPRLAQLIVDLVDRRARALLLTEGASTRYGIVAAVDAPSGTCSVFLGGSTTASPGIAYYPWAPVVGDKVRVVIAGADRYVDAVLKATAIVAPPTIALRYERSAAGQAIAAGEVVLTFPNTQRDDGGTTLAMASGIVTVARAGWVAASAGIVWPSNATGFRQLFLYGGSAQRASIRDAAPSGGGLPQTISAAWYAAAGEQVSARADQSSGATLTTSPSERNHLSVVFLG